MKRVLLGGTAAWVLLAVSPASAEVFVDADIRKEKTITVLELVDIEKRVALDVDVEAEADKFAESNALVNQSNYFNYGCLNCAEKSDGILSSGNSNEGLLSINQSSGNMNNQGNAVSAAVDTVIIDDPDDPGDPRDPGNSGFAESQAAVSQFNGTFAAPISEGPRSVVGDAGNEVDSINLLFKDAVIGGSLNTNTGIVNANQAAGNMANQANALSLAVSLDIGGVALAEADLGQWNIYNEVYESDQLGIPGDPRQVGINKAAAVSGSINGNQGIVGVNQTVGNMANQANLVSFSVVAPLSSPSS
jgi:hypothetical protein